MLNDCIYYILPKKIFIKTIICDGFTRKVLPHNLIIHIKREKILGVGVVGGGVGGGGGGYQYVSI